MCFFRIACLININYGKSIPSLVIFSFVKKVSFLVQKYEIL